LGARTFRNGGRWIQISPPKDPKNRLDEAFKAAIQSFKKIRLPDGSDLSPPPLPDIEKKIREKWPDWSWPGPFIAGSRGPSWWLEGSDSTDSAIVRPEGMITFSAAASKMFYPWSQILGISPEELSTAKIQSLLDTFWVSCTPTGMEYYRLLRDGEQARPSGWVKVNETEINRELRCKFRLPKEIVDVF